jgi:hypothetical protein
LFLIFHAILVDLQVFSPSEYEKIVSGMPSGCFYVWMLAPTAPDFTDFIHARYLKVCLL